MGVEGNYHAFHSSPRSAVLTSAVNQLMNSHKTAGLHLVTATDEVAEGHALSLRTYARRVRLQVTQQQVDKVLEWRTCQPEGRRSYEYLRQHPQRASPIDETIAAYEGNQGPTSFKETPRRLGFELSGSFEQWSEKQDR